MKRRLLSGGLLSFKDALRVVEDRSLRSFGVPALRLLPVRDMKRLVESVNDPKVNILVEVAREQHKLTRKVDLPHAKCGSGLLWSFNMAHQNKVVITIGLELFG